MGRKERLKEELRKKNGGKLPLLNPGEQKVKDELRQRLESKPGMKTMPNPLGYKFSDVFGAYLRSAFPEQWFQSDKTVQTAAMIGVVAWNSSVSKKVGLDTGESEALYEKMITTLGPDTESSKKLIEGLIFIKESLYDDYQFIIQDFQASMNRGQFNLAVAALPVELKKNDRNTQTPENESQHRDEEEE